MLKSLNTRVNALKMVSKISDFKTRKMLANGIFLSKLSYLITVWSNCSKDLISSLQTVQNRAGRMVTNKNLETGNSDIMKQIGWLSVNQLIFYHKCLQLHSIKTNKSPEVLYNFYHWKYSYQTRQATKMIVKPKGTPRLQLSKGSYRWSAPECYNSLPSDITGLESKEKFKHEAKIWIRDNVPFKG